MASKKKSSSQKSARPSKTPRKRAARYRHTTSPVAVNGHANGHAVPLRTQTAQALQSYFAHLDGDHPRHLYELVLREVEEPLFRAVLDYVKGNQSRAAEVLGLNRGTLRKKLRDHGLGSVDH